MQKEFHPQGNSQVDRDMRRYRKAARRAERIKLLLKAATSVALGLFCWAAMATDQMADWIAITIIDGCLLYGAYQMDRCFMMGGAV